LTLAICFIGGLTGPGPYWVALLPLAGGLLLRLRGIVFGALLALISLAITSVRLRLPGIHDAVAPDQVYVMISLICFVIMISFLAYFFLKANALTVTDQTRKLDNLLNIVTHDIANPLTLISGHAELMIHQGEANDPHTLALKRIARASELINEILRKVRQIQAAKAGKLQLETSFVSLAETFDKLRFVFEDRLMQKQQKFHMDFPAAYQTARVLAEPVMLLNEVLSNLVSNAIKFSPVGSVIEIHVTHQQEYMRIEVRDRGIGIPRDLLPHIFDDFRSTSRPGTEGEAGTGFGLPLARHIVEAFGGSLHAESRSIDEYKKNCGTVFILLLRTDWTVKAQAKAS
jgi:signal transduction histidine kinase